MAEFVSALTPIMFLILLGYGLKHFQFLPPQAWPGIEKLTYYVLFPALLIRSLGPGPFAMGYAPRGPVATVFDQASLDAWTEAVRLLSLETPEDLPPKVRRLLDQETFIFEDESINLPYSNIDTAMTRPMRFFMFSFILGS